MLTMRCHFLWAKVTILSLLICIEGSNRNRLTKRTIEDKFEVLLNLYKINPLRQSKLYKQFSNRILLPNKVDTAPPVMHFDSNESVKERKERTNVHLKQIEDAIHVTRHQNNKTFPPAPSYSVQEIGEEKFSSFITFKDVQRLKKFKLKKDGEIFDDIFEHIESSEIPDNEKKKGEVQERITAKPRKIATELNIKKVNLFKSNENLNKVILSTEEVVILS